MFTRKLHTSRALLIMSLDYPIHTLSGFEILTAKLILSVKPSIFCATFFLPVLVFNGILWYAVMWIGKHALVIARML